MKRCTKCGVEKDESEFGSHKKGAGGLRSSCKECINKANAERYLRSKDKWRATRKAWQEANPEKRREYYRNYVERDPERVKAVRRAKFERTRERCYAVAKLWRLSNPDKAAAIYKRGRLKNPLLKAKHTAKHNLKISLGFPPPAELVEAKAMQYLINKTIKELTK